MVGVRCRIGRWRWSVRGRAFIWAVCARSLISRSQLRAWRKQLLGPDDPDGRKRAADPAQDGSSSACWGAETLQQENALLKRALAEKVLEADFIKGALARVEARRRQSESAGAKTSTPTCGR